MERAIHISSINRGKTEENRPDNFIIKFNLPLNLNPDMKHSLAIDRLTMTYSWYNIRSHYKNNTIKYTNDRGVNWYTITYKDGMYSYTDIDDYLHQYMQQKNHHTTDSQGNKKFHININFILSTYRDVSVSFLSRVDELNKLASLQCMGLHSSGGRALQRYAEATGSIPVEAPKNFFSGCFRNCLNCDSLRWSHTHFNL